MRGGATTTFSDFDHHNLPRRITLPGNMSLVASYDARGNPSQLTFPSPAGTVTNDFTYDALGRMRAATSNVPNASPVGASFEYDLIGYNNSTVVTIESLPYTILSVPRRDGSTSQVTYPSGTIVNYTRAPSGQLQSVDVAGTTVASFDAYATASRPRTLTMAGGAITRTDEYDHRRRLLSRRYSSNGATLAHLRYAYDEANRETASQDVRRAGRTTLSSYEGDRLSRVDVAARTSAVATPPWAVQGTPLSWSPGDTAYSYTYDTSNEDRVVAVRTQTWQADAPPVVARAFGPAISAYGHIELVDGSTRTIDALGNVTSLEGETGTMTLAYDAQSQLRTVTRADASSVTYEYRADGLLSRRTVTCATGAAGCVPSDRAYIYDGLLLREEWELVGGSRVLQARYLYADEGDVPIGVELLDGSTQTMARHYYLVDRMGSVIGLVDDQGTVVERVTYSPWGRPTITTPDSQPPVVSYLEGAANGTLLVVFSEPVDPPLTAAAQQGTTIVAATAPLDDVLTVSGAQGTVAGTLELEDHATHPSGTAYRWTPSTPLTTSSTYTISVASAVMQDEWGNSNAAESHLVTYAAGVMHAGPSVGSTAQIAVERSALGNGLLFQAHLYDADVDLYLMRARVFDPNTGMFLQRDPNGYEDSVNLYAGFRWDPVNNRDPTGRLTKEEAKRALEGLRARQAARRQRYETTGQLDDPMIGLLGAWGLTAAIGTGMGALEVLAGSYPLVAKGLTIGGWGLGAAQVKSDEDADLTGVAAMGAGGMLLRGAEAAQMSRNRYIIAALEEGSVATADFSAQFGAGKSVESVQSSINAPADPTGAASKGESGDAAQPTEGLPSSGNWQGRTTRIGTTLGLSGAGRSRWWTFRRATRWSA